MFALDETKVLLVDAVADNLADRIVEAVAQNRRRTERHHQQLDVENSRGGESACRKQQGVTRQKRGDHQAGFREHDAEQDCVGQGPVALDDHAQILVEMQKNIDEMQE